MDLYRNNRCLILLQLQNHPFPVMKVPRHVLLSIWSLWASLAAAQAVTGHVDAKGEPDVDASASLGSFYAQWQRLVTVSFDPNGGVCPIHRKNYAVGQAYASFPVPTRADHVFWGWHTRDGIRVSASCAATATRTNLVAHWGKTLSLHPVGDSMTYGVRTRNNPLLNGAAVSDVAKIANQGWRGYLNKTLASWGKAHGRAIVFRGKHPQSSFVGNVPHDGYCGEQASAYAHNHPDACSVEADVQIVFLGMNDALAISMKSDPSSYIAALEDGYGRVLSSLHAGSATPLTILVTEPKVTSLVTQHNPLYKPGPINNVITGCINPYVRSRKGPNVLILDIQSLYSNPACTDDGFHLSNEGNLTVASRLAKLVEGFWQE